MVEPDSSIECRMNSSLISFSRRFILPFSLVNPLMPRYTKCLAKFAATLEKPNSKMGRVSLGLETYGLYV